MKLSIIVPIYNVASYLRKCVDSLLTQDYSDYEIILVDDGSPDVCPQICDEYDAKYDNIRVVHRENGGLSAARNSGIDVAQGEYVMFVDSDDYLVPNVLGKLIRIMEEKKLDVLRYNYQNINEQYEIFHPNKDPKRDVDYSESVVDGETFLNGHLGPACYAWQFVIKRSLIIGDRRLEIGDCLFTPGIYFEDTEWTPRMLLRAKRVASIPMVVYNYLWRTGSITLPTDSQKRKKVLDDKIKLLYGFQEQSRLVKDSKWFVWMTSSIVIGILNHLVSLSPSQRKPYLDELNALRIFPLSTKKEKMVSHRIKIIIANISPAFYCRLMSLRK